MMDVPQHRRCANRLPAARLLMLTLLATLVAVEMLTTTVSCANVFFVRSPESTIAPMLDEVLFECEMNLDQDRLVWRFRRAGGSQRNSDYMYLNITDNYDISTSDRVSKLRITVGPHSDGDYQCVAWFGDSAIASIPARLTRASIAMAAVQAAADQAKPVDRSWHVQSGNAVLVKCAPVVSDPPAVWSFYKDSNLVPATHHQLSTGTLVLLNVRPSDSGTYTCVAVNSITGMELRMQHRITILVDGQQPRSAPTLLLTSGSSVAITSPSAVTRFAVRRSTVALLECPGYGNPVPKSVWSRPDADIARNRTSVLDYGLQIVDTQPSDAGTYVCRLDNGIAPALVHTVLLEVLEAPQIVRGPRDQKAVEGGSVSLECVVHGSPAPDVYWMVNGEDTRKDASVSYDRTHLVLRKVEKRHAGYVQCFARNEVGEVNSIMLLEVEPKQITGDVADGDWSGGGGGQQQQQNQHYQHHGQGSVPSPSRQRGNGGDGGGNGGAGGKSKGHNKHKHTVMIPPSSPSVTRLSDDKVMVRWSVPPSKAGHLPIQFFKVQYRMLGDIHQKVNRSIWMTSNEDIPSSVNMYEVIDLKPDHYYRFRIAAVYSNNDNKLSNVSTKFLLQRGSQLDPHKSNLIAPNLTSVEAISQTAVMLHWYLPTGGRHPMSPVEGFYAYYRPASTAGEYSKATVDGMHTKKFKIDKLEPGTAYEFKLQSFTAAAASDFLAILTGKTLTPSTPAPFPQDVRLNETQSNKPVKHSYLPLIASLAGAASLLLLSVIMICVCIKRRRGSDEDDDANENKSHPDHIQAEPNGYPSGNGRNGGNVLGSASVVMQKANRLNGVVPRMNITANPLSGADHSALSANGGGPGDKNRNVMELRFMPSNNATTATAATANNHNHNNTGHNNSTVAMQQLPQTPPSPTTTTHIPSTPPLPAAHALHNNHHHPQQQQHNHHNHHHQLPPQHPNHLHQQQQSIYNQHLQQQQPQPPPPHHLMLRQSPTSPEAVRRTLDRSHRNINHHYDTPEGIGGSGSVPPPLRRGTMAGGGVGRHIPGSPRVLRGGVSSELLQNRSPMPQRAAALAGKRGRLGSRTENMSSGSLNSIEV